MKSKRFQVISRFARSLFVVLILGGLSGSVAIPQPLSYPDQQSPQAKTADGIRLVSNPIQPRDGVQKPKYTQEWSIGGENDTQSDLINRPYEISLGKDGSVYVLDWGDTCLRQFDAKGKFVRQIGRKGQGPGEYDVPAYFDLDAADNIFLADGRSLRVTRFDKAGKPVGQFRLEKYCTQIRVDRQGRLYLGENSSVDSGALSSEFKEMVQQLTIRRSGADGLNPLRIGPFIGQKFMIKAMGQNSMLSTSSPYSPMSGWDIAPDGRLFVGYNGKYDISVCDSDGKVLFRFGREYMPLKIKSDRPVRKGEEYYPAFAPDFFFDDAGNSWFRLYKNEDDKEFRFDVFSPEGIYLKQVVVPFRIYQVRNGKAYAIVETDEGFKSLRCYRLE